MENINKLDMDSIIKSIESANTREEVENVIVTLKKKNLLIIAKYFNVYISRNDKINMITKKIVENTIGTKLRIEAIKSIDLRIKDR